MAVRNSIPCDGICSCSLDGQTKTGENNQKILQEYLKWIVKLNLSVKLLCDSVNRNFYKTRIHLRSSWETNGFKMLQMKQLSHRVCFCSLEITEFRKHPKKDIAARKHSIKQVSLYVPLFQQVRIPNILTAGITRPQSHNPGDFVACAHAQNLRQVMEA